MISYFNAIKQSLLFSFISSMYTLVLYAPPFKPLIIILDTQRQETLDRSLSQESFRFLDRPAGINAMAYTLLVALDQQAAPIITNTSLLKTIIDHALLFHEFINDHPIDLFRKYGSYNRFASPDLIDQFIDHSTYSFFAFQKIQKTLASLILKTEQKHIHSVLTSIAQNANFSYKYAPTTLTDTFTNKINRAHYHEMATYIMCSETVQRLKKWVIKSVDSTLCLLLPPDKHPFSLDIIKKPELTTLELTLGLKVNHKPTLSLNYFKKRLKQTSEISIPSLLQTLFITNQEYRYYKKAAPLWNIYLAGHGTPSENRAQYIQYYKQIKKHTIHHWPHFKRYINTIKKSPEYYGSIAGLTLGQFTKLLRFFNAAITTNCLFYTSCYAGGIHLVTPYHSNAKPLCLNYTVIAGALAEAPIKQEMPLLAIPPYNHQEHQSKIKIYGITPASLDSNQKKLKIISPLKFNAFFSVLSQPILQKNICIEATNNLYAYTTPYGSIQKNALANIPSIRLAKKEKFKLLLPLKGILLLDRKFLGQNKQKRQELLSEAKVLVFDTPGLAYTLDFSDFLSNTELPVSIAAHATTYSYTLSELTAPHHTLLEILTMLLPLPELHAPRIFTIKKLAYKHNNIRTTITNVLISYQNHARSTQPPINVTYTQAEKRFGLTYKPDNLHYML